MEAGHQILTVIEGQSHKLVAAFFAKSLALIADCISLLISVVHLHNYQEKVSESFCIGYTFDGMLIRLKGGRTVKQKQPYILGEVIIGDGCLGQSLKYGDEMVLGDGMREVIGQKLIRFVFQELN